LHDGDEVEVDANNGVVKILEKAGEKNKARKCGEIGGKRKGELDEAVKEGGLG
jgi:bifunctional DNA-binding transcriptional regulator/antitoxin component of YhaV-PrlF toxin-antitoxin module